MWFHQVYPTSPPRTVRQVQAIIQVSLPHLLTTPLPLMALQLEATKLLLLLPVPRMLRPLMDLQPEATELLLLLPVFPMPHPFMDLQLEATMLLLCLPVLRMHHLLIVLQRGPTELVVLLPAPRMPRPLMSLQPEATERLLHLPVPLISYLLMSHQPELTELVQLRLAPPMPLPPTVRELKATEVGQLNPGTITLLQLVLLCIVPVILPTLEPVHLIGPRLLVHTTVVRIRNHTVQRQPRRPEHILHLRTALLHRIVLQ